VPTKKQRRRQQKTRRHEWEYVYVDEEGQEVELEPAELRAEKKEREKERPRAAAASRQATGRRPGRTIQPPSWRRVIKRALIFSPIFIIVLMLLNRNQSVATSVAPALFLLVFFVPFSYFTDWLAYRTFQKRMGGADAATAKPRAKPKTR